MPRDWTIYCVPMAAVELVRMAHLTHRPTGLQPRRRLIDNLWPEYEMSEQILDGHQRNLRRKLASAS